MKKSRRAPFVVTIALAAAGSGCGGSTSSGDGSGGTGSGGSGGSVTGGTGGVGGVGATGGYGANPPGIPCPAELPAEGSACPAGNWWGNSCAFVDPCGGSEPFIAECNQQTLQWHQLGSTNCACPVTAPTPGSACSVPSTEYCNYSDGCCPSAYSCQDGTWTASGVSCNPPYLECPSTPPADGDPCNDCALGLDNCAWNQACNGGPWETFGSCVNGGWKINQSPCLYDGGGPYPYDAGVIIVDAGPGPADGNPPWPDGAPPNPTDGGISVLDGGGAI